MADLDLAIKAVQHYAETHPRPSHVTRAQAANMLGLNAVKVGRMVKSGDIKVNKCGRIPIIEVDLALKAREAANDDQG